MPTPQDRQAARGVARPVQVALAILILALAGAVAAGAVGAYRIYSEGNHRFVDQAGPFFAVTEDMAAELLNEETGVRGYVISGDPKLLAPYYQGKKYLQLELAQAERDQSYDSHIPAHLAALRKQVATLDAYFADEIALVKSGPAGQRRAQAQIVAGKGHFDHLRSATSALVGDAVAVINRSRSDQHSSLVTWLVVLGIAGAVGLAIAVALLLRVPRRLEQLFRKERMARHEAEQAADAARALAHVREAVLLLDTSGVVRYRNPSAEEVFGPQPAAGETEALREILERFRSEEVDAQPLRVVLDGRERWLTCAESTFDGGRVVVFRDVTDGQRLERLRADFVATASHELRTPLAAVYGAVRTLRQKDHELPADLGAQFLQMIETESERLRLVMDQLLVSAELDSADIHLQHQTVDAVELCRSVIVSAQLRIPSEIELTLDAQAPEIFVDADPDRLRQVVANLVDNAIKYSPMGGRVELRGLVSGGSAVIQVADHGLGIPAHEQQRIFEKFYRLDPAMTRGVGGSGLGLYISREIVQQMGGQLTVVSRHGYGSTFSVRLPLVDAEPERSAEPALAAAATREEAQASR